MSDDVDRKEHLAWAKERAMVYVTEGDFNQAFASFVSDLSKHDGTRNHMGVELGRELLISGNLNNAKAITDWIMGCN